MAEEKINFTEHPDYHKLPRVLKELYSPKEHAWLTDFNRHRVEEIECYPEVEEEA